MQTHLAQAARAKPSARSISIKCFLPQAPTQFLSSAPSFQDVISNIKLYLYSFKHGPVGQQQFLLLAGKSFLFWTTYWERIANSVESHQRQGNFLSYHWKSGRSVQAKSRCLKKSPFAKRQWVRARRTRAVFKRRAVASWGIPVVPPFCQPLQKAIPQQT